MFGLSAFNRLLRARQQQQDRPVLNATDALSAKQLKAAMKVLRLLKLHKSLEALARDDMMEFLFAVGMNPTPDVLESKLRLLRLHKQQSFTWGVLAHVWSMLLRDAANEDQILERAFAFFDKDGNGEISVSELRTTMSELGHLLTEDEICAFIAIMDVDNDGVIGYQEFLQTLRSEVPQLSKGPGRRTLEGQAEYHSIINTVYSGSGAKQQGQQFQQQLTGNQNRTSRCSAALEDGPSTSTSPDAAATATAGLTPLQPRQCMHNAGGTASMLPPLNFKQQQCSHMLQELPGLCHPVQLNAPQQQGHYGFQHPEQQQKEEQQLSSPVTRSSQQQQQQAGTPEQQHDGHLPTPRHWSPRRQQQQLEDEQQQLPSSRRHKQKHIRYQEELQDEAMRQAVQPVPGSAGESDMCQQDGLPGQTQDGDCELAPGTGSATAVSSKATPQSTFVTSPECSASRRP